MPYVVKHDGMEFDVAIISEEDSYRYQNDHDTWFMLEDGSALDDFIAKLKAAGDGTGPLLMLDEDGYEV